MKEKKLTYLEWLSTCVLLLESNKNRALYFQALTASGYLAGGRGGIVYGGGVLEMLRGDEPRDAYTSGDTPEAYVSFLISEWKLFGPEGE